ncbi:MAG TPA: type II toxin-antitoxin system VapC family toxin [Alphaproteobacteria bacterium]|nr:type II toxin-antitoxin system VapC family toxin [Alphaproteobacteria bacterium]
MTMQLLLDTNAAIFAAEGLLKPKAADLLTQKFRAAELIHISPITGWEIGLLFSRGRLRASVQPREYLRRLLGLSGISVAPLSAEVLLESSFLPGDAPRDPADRIIAATAREYGFQVMTRDTALLAYAHAGHLSAVEC